RSGRTAGRGMQMDANGTFQRKAGLAAMASAPLALGSLGLSLAAVSFNFGAFFNPPILLQAAAKGSSPWGLGMVLGLLGDSRLVVPLSLFPCQWLRPKAPGHVEVYTAGLLAYSLIGAIGAAMLATSAPPLMLDYASAAPPRRESLEITFLA